MKLLSDFGKKISETLGMTVQGVEEFFEVYEDREGYFIAKPKPSTRWIDTPQFNAMCTLARRLGGDYVEGARAWKVPGPFAKKTNTTSTPEPAKDARSKTEPSGVTPRSMTDDKSRPPQFMVPVKALLSMPFQSRVTSKMANLDELVESIRSVGVLHPILVRPKPDGLYEVVMGERRVAAAKKLGLFEVPATIRFLSDQEAYEIQLAENIQREDLSDMEKARMLDFMIKKFGYTQRALAEKLCKHEAWVSHHLSMLEFEKLAPGQVQEGKITERQAREILAAPEEKREEILDRINETGEIPSAREIRRAVQPERLQEPIGAPAEHHLESERQVTEGRKPLLTGFEVECPECHVKLLINHVDHPNGKVTHEVEG